MTNKKGEIVKAEEQENAIVEYTSVHFDDLNSSIQKLGNHKGRLSKEDKILGAKLLDEWNDNVRSRIDQKLGELSTVKQFFGMSHSYGDFEEPEYQALRENLAKLSGTVDEYTKWLMKAEEVEFLKLEKPQRPIIDPTISEVENDLKYTGYNKELVLWDIKDKKLKFEKQKLWNTWIISMKKTNEIKKFLSKLSQYEKQLKDYKNDCDTKTHMAKVNIAISNKDVRESVQELLQFSEKFRPMK